METFYEPLWTAKGRNTGCAIRVGFMGNALLYVKIKTWSNEDPAGSVAEDQYEDLTVAVERLEWMAQYQHYDLEIRGLAYAVAKYLKDGWMPKQ